MWRRSSPARPPWGSPACSAAVRRALASGPVDAEHISAALDAYLLVGIAFGAGYWLLEAAVPGSFSLGAGGALAPQRAVYFSFVTQATLGYGDIVPIGEHAEGVVIVQGVGGQMYLARRAAGESLLGSGATLDNRPSSLQHQSYDGGVR